MGPRIPSIDGTGEAVGGHRTITEVNVTRSLGRAIASISNGAPELGAHLRVSVQTGRYCRYTPEPAAAME